MAIHSGDDRQRLVPLAVVSVLTTLIDDLEATPTAVRVELRSVRSRLCRAWRIPDPQAQANATSVAQDVAEEDGECVDA